MTVMNIVSRIVMLMLMLVFLILRFRIKFYYNFDFYFQMFYIYKMSPQFLVQSCLFIFQISYFCIYNYEFFYLSTRTQDFNFKIFYYFDFISARVFFWDCLYQQINDSTQVNYPLIHYTHPQRNLPIFFSLIISIIRDW